MKPAFLILTFAIASACSSNPADGTSAGAKTAQTNAAGEELVCTYEKPTGSFLKEKRCTTAAQREAKRGQQDTLIDVREGRDIGQ